jgi:hypothetical protein
MKVKAVHRALLWRRLPPLLSVGRGLDLWREMVRQLATAPRPMRRMVSGRDGYDCRVGHDRHEARGRHVGPAVSKKVVTTRAVDCGAAFVLDARRP